MPHNNDYEKEKLSFCLQCVQKIAAGFINLNQTG
jgi:hypothetical protein